MTRFRTIIVIVAALLSAWTFRALADYIYPDPVNGNTTVFSFVCFTTKICPGQVMLSAAGADIGTPLLAAVQSNVPLGVAGGWTAKFVSALSTTVTSIKATAGQLGYVQCDNNNTNWTYVQIFNVASGSVTLGTTVPVQVIPLAPGLPNGFVMNLEGMQYGTAISTAATTSSTGSTAPATALSCSFGFN